MAVTGLRIRLLIVGSLVRTYPESPRWLIYLPGSGHGLLGRNASGRAPHRS